MSNFEIPERILTWRMVPSGQNHRQRKIESCFIPTPEICDGDVLVKIAGCGVCGTDISLISGEVQPVSRLPLTLGHEISGEVISGDERWVGTKVIIPTILPCNNCELCRNERSNRCLSQKMLGYSFGPYGGFSTHVVVPGKDLCEIPGNTGFDLPDLAVVADAVATPFQAAKKADLGQGDKVIIIGPTGGLGIYMTQWAKALGASIVIGIGRDPEKMKIAEKYGLDISLSTKEKSSFDVLCDFTRVCRKNGINYRSSWKIFEMTGSSDGQRLGLELLSYVSTLVVVGYGITDLSYNFSKLMAYDSEIVGSWGCEPRHYPEILNYVLEGHIDIRPFVEQRPLHSISETFREIQSGRKSIKRIVLTPET